MKLRNKLFGVLLVSGTTVTFTLSNVEGHHWLKEAESSKIYNQSEVPYTKYNNNLSR